jgi:hypothetical protein
MSELDAGHRTLLRDETHDARPCIALRVVPETGVAGRDATFLRHGRRLGENETGTADRAAAEMDEMPVVRHAVDRRVFAHRRDDDAVAKRHVADRRRIEEMHPVFLQASG